jgi:hypothetical protein
MAGARATDVPGATRLVGDPRALHYWDEEGALVRAYREVLGIDEPAWDVYMIYPPGVRWVDPLPPAPVFWMHQLGQPSAPRVTQAPYLDPAAFAARVGSAERRSREP